MIPARIHQIWLGSPIPSDMREMIATVWANHPQWSCIVWTENQLGALGLDAAKLKEELGSWAAVSNLVRLKVLQKFGGFYLDTDFVCHKSLEPFLVFGAVAAEQDGGRLCNAFLGAEIDHPWINWQLEYWDGFDQRDAASGVYLATAAPREGLTIIPSHLAYPYSYDAAPENRKPHPDSILEHKWVGSWKA